MLVDPNEIEGNEDLLRLNRSGEKEYSFDYAFDQATSQEEVFEATTKRLVDNAIDGYNATCFAYGATGAGKTFT